MATAPARDGAAPSVSQPEDILPKRANDSEPLPLNYVADAKDNNSNEISRDNADTSIDELDFQPLESRPHSHNVTPYEQQVFPVASNTRVKARGTVEAVTMGTRPRPRFVADRDAISRSGLKAAPRASRVHMFVSRLDSGTTSDQLKEHLSNHNIDVFCIEALETKHHSYASFKITIPSNKFMIFRSDQVWPEGIYVRKFYGTRNAASTNLWWRSNNVTIKIACFNCKGLRSTLHDVKSLWETHDLVFLQETWLMQHNMSILHSIHDSFYGDGVSAVNTENWLAGPMGV